VEDYLATFKLVETDTDSCRIEWSSTFEPVGTSGEKAKPVIEGIYNSGIKGLKETLGLKSVEMTAELADGWLPIFYYAEKAKERWGAALDAGRAKRDPNRAPLEIFAGGAVGIGEGLEDLRGMGRHISALYIGGMGARGKNFYNDLFASYGYEKEAKEIQDLYLDGKKQEAAMAIPESFIEATTLIGPEGFVKERLAALKESGVTTLNVMLVGNDTKERVKTLDKLRNLVDLL
jgi:alkanesulfonate monooxygenase SsuD/methylene tetrahydromethanopterin reductase-like flavin-dependent oxidoreductase (luciferase family)